MHRNSIRNDAAVVAAALGVALVVFGFIRLLGVEPMAGKSGDRSPVGVIDVFVAALLAGVAACAVHAFMVRWRRVRWWPAVGSAALAISIIGPSYLSDGGSAVALICMHFAVGGALIGGLGLLSNGERRCDDSPREGRPVPHGY